MVIQHQMIIPECKTHISSIIHSEKFIFKYTDTCACIYTYIYKTLYEYAYTFAYIYVYVYVTINNEEAMNLNMSKKGCMGGFRERKWEEKICNYIAI